MTDLNALARKHRALEKVGRSDFQRRARILQSMWREEQGYPTGSLAGKKRGAMLEMPWAEETLANFMSHAARGMSGERSSIPTGTVRRSSVDPGYSAISFQASRCASTCSLTCEKILGWLPQHFMRWDVTVLKK